MSKIASSPLVRLVLTPLRDWSARWRLWAVLLAVTITATITYHLSQHFGSYFVLSDVAWYIDLARGHFANVMQPFASRQLGPAVVRFFSWISGWPVERVFVVQGLLSLLTMLAVVYALMVRTATPGWLLPAFFLLPFWTQLFLGLALPDLWYAALLALFLLLLARRHYLLAALMIFPLMVSRESTSLTLVCFLLAGWRLLRWRDRIVSVVAFVAGTALVQHLAARSPGNREHLPEILYIALKIPWNFARNILGVDPWSNVYPILCHTPEWQHSLQFGPVHALGICGISPQMPLLAAVTALDTFGLLPLLVVYFWIRSRKTPGRSLLFRFCLLYGAVSFLIAPMVGVWFYRLYGYGWPIFLVALPLFFNELSVHVLKPSRALAGVAFLALHFCACLLAYPTVFPLALRTLPVLYLAGFFLLRYLFSAGDSSQTAPISPPPSVVKST